MNAGREMDALIAEKVMGEQISRSCTCCHGATCPRHDDPKTPLYSTKIADAWSVVERLAKPFKVVWTGRVWVCEVFSDLPSEEADTAPLAICRAALEFAAELKRAEVDA